jgi:uncharacterized membrane protein
MSDEQKDSLPFHKENYLFLIIGVALVILGFVLMAGGGNENPEVYSDEVFSTQRITVAPLLVLSGFAVVMVGIFRKSKKQEN